MIYNVGIAYKAEIVNLASDIIVGIILCFSVVASMNMAYFGGSSAFLEMR